jgi:hypothetical protein
VLDRQVEADAEPAQHEMGDAVQRAVARMVRLSRRGRHGALPVICRTDDNVT